MKHWGRVGPALRYTNDRARDMERNVEGFARLVNDDLYDLLKWAAALNGEIDRLNGLIFAVVDGEGNDHYEAIAALRAHARETRTAPSSTTERSDA